MVITQPTVDDFSDTTVMRVIRKIVNYICNDLVDGINNNDIVSGQFSVQGNQLSGTLTKGDGTIIDIPATTLPSGGGSDNPYPTAVSMTISGTTLNFNMAMSNGTPITGSVNLASILEGYATNVELQEEISGLKLSSTNNNMTFNGNSVDIVKTVSGSVSNNDLTVTVNGVNSAPIALPLSSNGNVYIDKDINSSADLAMGESYNWILYQFRYDGVDYVFIGPLIYSTDKTVVSSNGSTLLSSDGSRINRVEFNSTGKAITLVKDGSSNKIDNPTLYNQITMILRFSETAQ